MTGREKQEAVSVNHSSQEKKSIPEDLSKSLNNEFYSRSTTTWSSYQVSDLPLSFIVLPTTTKKSEKSFFFSWICAGCVLPRVLILSGPTLVADEKMASSSSTSSSSSSSLKSTIWIGNIDTKSTEAQILKLVKPFGKVLKFDFIYTLKDNERVPRGYAFVTYDNYVSADKAIRGLSGLRVLSKTLKVQPASSNNTNVSNSTSNTKTLPATLSASLGSKTSDSSSKVSKIKALEAQLKALDKKPDQFKLVPEGKKARPKPYDRKSWQWHFYALQVRWKIVLTILGTFILSETEEAILIQENSDIVELLLFVYTQKVGIQAQYIFDKVLWSCNTDMLYFL